MTDSIQDVTDCPKGKCPSKSVAQWSKFLAGVLIMVAPQIPGVGPIIAAHPDLAMSVAGGVVALLTGQAPAAATRGLAKRVKNGKPKVPAGGAEK